MVKNVRYEDTCNLTCTDNGRTAPAEILDFRPGKMLTCSVNRQVKLTLSYNEKHKNYVGSMSGMEFTTNGPAETVTYNGRN